MRRGESEGLVESEKQSENESDCESEKMHGEGDRERSRVPWAAFRQLTQVPEWLLIVC